MSMKKILTAFVALAASAVSFASEETPVSEDRCRFAPIGFGVFAPVQSTFAGSDVYGLRLGGIYGSNVNVYGLDVGVIESVSDDFIGLAIGVANLVQGETIGMQLGAFCCSGEFSGVQIGALGNWNSFSSYGFQVGAVNVNQESFDGLSVGALNMDERFRGLQIGVFNTASEAVGVQIGVFNACDSFCGVQIGLVNIIDDSVAPIMPIANASF